MIKIMYINWLFFDKGMWLQLGHSTMESKENDKKIKRIEQICYHGKVHLNYKIVSHKLNPSVQH